MIWHNIMEELFKNPRFEQVLAEPYGGRLPLDFTLPADLVRRPICALPGSFNRYKDELFAPDMLTDTVSLTPTAGLASPAGGPASKPARSGASCDVFKDLTVAQLGDAPAVAEGDQKQPAVNPTNYCKPVDGVAVPDGMLATIKVWNLPPFDPDEKVDYHWSGGGAVSAEQIPDCTDAMIASVAPPGSVRMPDLRRFGENQAKDKLAELGVTNVYVDYQDRTRIPDLYDQYVPYAVVSTLPAPGEYIPPGTTVVLGVRAPDPGPPPEPDVPPAPDVPTPPVP